MSEELNSLREKLKEAQDKIGMPEYSEDEKLRISSECAYFRREIKKAKSRIQDMKKKLGGYLDEKKKHKDYSRP